VRVALTEDLGDGDVTSAACVDEAATAEAVLLSKADGVLAGLEVALVAFRELDPEAQLEARCQDGDRLRPGVEVARVSGRARALLSAERVALNFVQRLSGVATLTHRFVERLEGTGTVVLDTRKTTPGLRFLEKYAVLVGGGANHRFGLFDMYLVKDNHVRAAGGVTAAIERIRKDRDEELLLEVETTTLPEVREACIPGVDRILLDNMTQDLVRRSLEIVDAWSAEAPPSPRRREGAKRWPEVEVSGGVRLETVRVLGELGVDYVSVGALTHSAPALDLSLEITRLG
jgi:nicotinate-nucleotide pyrophosphorylase (carboxylating)